jgi:1-acyl-sn-glycerol-3-phosphate acyltransferase
VTIDGFHTEKRDALADFDPQIADLSWAGLDWISQKLSVEIVGAENIPAGRALLVANHAFAWDAMFPMAAVWKQFHRPLWVLGEHLWWKIPFVRRLAAALGTVDGTPDNVDRLLAHDELVLVLPGGLREAVKPRELRYRLLWGHRYGFIRSAIKNQAPIVPLVGIGADEIFDFVGNAHSRGTRWLRSARIPVPLPTYFLPIPHRVHLRYVFGEPILPRFGADRADDPAALLSLRREVEGALHEMIEVDLAKRIGIDLT